MPMQAQKGGGVTAPTQPQSLY